MWNWSSVCHETRTFGCMPEPPAHRPDPPLVTRDLAEDEPDLPCDEGLQNLVPKLPDFGTDPVPPGPRDHGLPAEAAGAPEGLEEMADAVEEGRLPE